MMKIRNDIIFIVTILLIVSIAGFSLLLSQKTGDTVTVTVNGQTWGEYSLHEDRSVEIKNGDGYNLLVIENGGAYVKHANCSDGICSLHRPISHSGESIICLPNKVVVEVHAQDQKQPDIIS